MNDLSVNLEHSKVLNCATLTFAPCRTEMAKKLKYDLITRWGE